MYPRPPVSFYLADVRTPVRPGGSRWHRPVPVHRRDLSAADENQTQETPVCYGDYFSAAADFLQQQLGPLAAAVSRLTASRVPPDHICDIRIFLEKHGAFYHPARVVVRCEEGTASLALNLAVGAEGKRLVGSEYELLGRLGEKDRPWLPRVFLRGSGRTLRGEALPMFLAQWFEGFCEFHLTEEKGMALWDPTFGRRPVREADRRDIYRGVARIFGDYYRIETGARIHPWHHAAGDFIARIDEDGVALRLITVRGYPAALPNEASGPEKMLRALLVAFFHFSLRTRIDRVDGTGELLWADETAVEPTLIGFCEALAEKPVVVGGSDSAAIVLLDLLGRMPQEAAVLLGKEALEGFSEGSPEAALAREHLLDHLGELAAAVRSLSLPHRPV